MGRPTFWSEFEFDNFFYEDSGHIRQEQDETSTGMNLVRVIIEYRVEAVDDWDLTKGGPAGLLLGLNFVDADAPLSNSIVLSGTQPWVFLDMVTFAHAQCLTFDNLPVHFTYGPVDGGRRDVEVNRRINVGPANLDLAWGPFAGVNVEANQRLYHVQAGGRALWME